MILIKKLLDKIQDLFYYINHKRFRLELLTSNQSFSNNKDSDINFFNLFKEKTNLKDTREKLKKEKSDIEKRVLEQRKLKRDVRKLEEKHAVSKEDEMAYLDYLSTLGTVEGQGIVSPQLKIIGAAIIGALLIIFLIGNFLNQNNPLIPLFNALGRPVVISIMDSNNVKILEVRRENTDIIEQQDIPNNILASFLALHSILEIMEQNKRTEPELKDIKDNEITPEQISNYIGRKSNLIKDIALSLQGKDGGLVNNITSGLISRFSENDCISFITTKDLENTAQCSYDYVNFTLHNIYQEQNQNAFFAIFSPIKNKLLSNWIKESVSPERFLELFFNIGYYGNHEIGLTKSYNKYFPEHLINDMTLEQSIFLIYQLFHHSKKYYPDYNISVRNIVEMLAINNPSEGLDVDYITSEVETIIEEKSKIDNLSFFVILNDIFLRGYNDYFPAYTEIQIHTSVLTTMQNMVLQTIARTLETQKIETSGSFILTRYQQVIATSSFYFKDRRFEYNDSYPMSYAYSVLKPFLYLSMLEYKVDVSTLLLKSQYQNLIFSNRRFDLRNALIAKAEEEAKAAAEAEAAANFDPTLIIGDPEAFATLNNSNEVGLTTPVLPESSTQELNDLLFLEDEDLSQIPVGLKKQFAEQLNYFELQFLQSVNPEYFQNTFARLNLPYNTYMTVENIINGNIRLALPNILNAYNALSNETGELYDRITYINNINGIFELEQEKVLSIRPTYITILKDIYFNRVVTKGNNTYYILVDFQTSIVFGNGYLLILWLGEKDQENIVDNSEYVEKIVRNIIDTLG